VSTAWEGGPTKAVCHVAAASSAGGAMSIVDDRMHVAAERARRERLWQTTDTMPLVSPIRAPGTVTPGRADHPSNGGHSSHAEHPSQGEQDRAPDVIARASAGAGDQMWQTRIDLVVSSGLSGDAARKATDDAQREHDEAAFEALCELCRDELRPVLECSAEMLGEWGLTARVAEKLRDEPARVPRSFELALSIERFDDRGPGKLTITATEGCDFVRVKLAVGPTKMGGEVSEHVGTTIARDLSDALAGGLVATLVEQIFSL
jgi:hypothetical protein